MDNPLYLILLFGLGVIAGFQNMMAGGGSLLTLPMLIFMLESDPAYAANAGDADVCYNLQDGADIQS